MTTKQVLFRLDDSKLIALDNKLSDKGISKQFFLSKCVELFLEDKLSFDNNVITNDSSEIAELKKQIAVILERLDKIEDDSKVIAFDTNITNNELESNDSIELLNDSLSIQSKEDTNQEDITENITLSELPTMPVNESEGVNIPSTENEQLESDIVSSDDELVNSESAVTENEDTANCDTKIGSLTDAIDNVILPCIAKKMKSSEIAKLLQGKYRASVNGTSVNWQGSVVDRAIQQRKKEKA